MKIKPSKYLCIVIFAIVMHWKLLIYGASAPIPDIAWWNMQNSGSIVSDLTGNGHTATVNGTPSFGFDTTIKKYYVQFDGNSWLRVENSSDLNLTTSWTISLWAKPGQLFHNVEFWVGL